jgi:hypothetical protein
MRQTCMSSSSASTSSAAQLLGPAAAPLLLLVIPIAVVARCWGRRPAWVAAIVAVGILAARDWIVGVDTAWRAM